MYGMGGAYILQTILVFLLMPETAYHRAESLNIDTTSHEDLSDAAKEINAEHKEVAAYEREEQSTNNDMSAVQGSNWMSARELLPWSGYSHKVNLFWITIRPFKLVLSPPVFWGTILYMTCISWLVLIAVTISQIFGLPPYNFSVEHVGLTNLSSFVASVLAAAVAQPLSDGIAVYMAKRNGGVYGNSLSFVPSAKLTNTNNRTRVQTSPRSVLPTLLCRRFLRLGPICLQTRTVAGPSDSGTRTSELRHHLDHHRGRSIYRRLPPRTGGRDLRVGRFRYKSLCYGCRVLRQRLASCRWNPRRILYAWRNHCCSHADDDTDVYLG